MTKLLNRVKAKLAREALRESAKDGKNWIISKNIILEAEDENGDMSELEFTPGDVAEIGATEDGDMAVKSSAAVVVISDEELAKKIADTVVSSDELSDVKFVDRPALDAVMDGEDTEEVVDKMSDDDDNIEVAEVEVEKKESVDAKFAKFAEHVIHANKTLKCEAIRIDESEESPINMAVIKADRVMVENFDNYDKFISRVSELKASIQPGEKEVVLSESNKVIGSFEKATQHGVLFLENEFDSIEDMESFDVAPENLETDIDLDVMEGAESDDVEEKVEACLKKYEESAKSGADYIECVNGLEQIKLKESVIAKVISTFDNKSLKESAKAFDSKYGVFVKAVPMSESVEIDNFAADTKEEKRFTKRYFS